MKNKKIKNIVLISALGVFVLIVAMFCVLMLNKTTSHVIKNGSMEDYEESDESYDKETAIYIKLNGDSIETECSSVNFSKSTLTIKEEGVYVLSGTLNGKVVVDLDKDTSVRIVLAGVTITSSDGATIYASKSDKLVLTLESGTQNKLVDTTNYSNEDEKGVISSNDDITINGEGSLVIEANYKNGIDSCDSIKILNGNVEISAVNNGISANDDVKIKGGNISINAQNSGIKAKNEEDSSKGNIKIEKGSITINSSEDGLEASNNIEIEDGNINIITGGGSKNTTKIDQENFRQMVNERNTNSDTTESYKGIKAENSINIKGGNINVDSADDSIHSNGDVVLDGGEISLSSGDDGIHANSNVTISNASIDINKSYEGIEGVTVTINSGNIKVKSSDDGINVAGGSNNNNSIGFQDEFASNDNNKLVINGGIIYVNADGDGLDSNGNIYVNGGNIVVDGPTNNGNGALDYNGEFVQKGGCLIAAGASGMAQEISSNSEEFAVSVYFTSNQSANTKVTITDSQGNEILSYTSTKSFSHVILSSDKLKKSEKYKLNVNGDLYEEFTMSSTITTIGNKTSGNGMGQVPKDMDKGGNQEMQSMPEMLESPNQRGGMVKRSK